MNRTKDGELTFNVERDCLVVFAKRVVGEALVRARIVHRKLLENQRSVMQINDAVGSRVERSPWRLERGLLGPEDLRLRVAAHLACKGEGLGFDLRVHFVAGVVGAKALD